MEGLGSKDAVSTVTYRTYDPKDLIQYTGLNNQNRVWGPGYYNYKEEPPK